MSALAARRIVDANSEVAALRRVGTLKGPFSPAFAARAHRSREKRPHKT